MKMNWKIKVKDLKITKKQMTLWMSGILVAVIALMIFIVKAEPPAEGISRAEAAKAMALIFEDPENLENMAADREISAFTDKEKGNWFVKYMDYLYEKGYLDPKVTPATLISAQGNLTYEDAAYMMGKVSGDLEKQVGMTHWNRKKTFARNDWWDLYRAVVEKMDHEGSMKEISAILFGTPSNMEQADSWTAYTTEGNFGFQGLALDAYLDNEIRFWVRGQEIAGMTQVIEDKPVYKNIWISDVEKDQFTAYIGKYLRTFTAEGKLVSQAEKKKDELKSCVADLHMEKGKLKKVTVKKERVRGKVLAVTDDSIELEGYGCVPLDDNFHVYKAYGDFQVLGKGSILVGYDLQEFVAADGKLCAAILEQPLDAETIRVLIMDNGFKQIFHDTIELTANCDGEMVYEKENGDHESSSFKKGDTFTFEATDKKLENGDFLTMDFGCLYQGYCSDMTRTVVIGSASEKQREIYDTVLKAQETALLGIRPGLKGSQIDAMARDVITDAGYGKYFGHALGHSVGLEIHESPNFSPREETVIRPGMVITVEPGIYIEGIGGVRIEDVVIITEDGCENITHSTKKLLELTAQKG